MSRAPLAYVVLVLAAGPAGAQQPLTDQEVARMAAIAVCGKEVHRTTHDFALIPAKDGSFGVGMPVRVGSQIVLDTCVVDTQGNITAGTQDGPACGVAKRVLQCLKAQR